MKKFTFLVALMAVILCSNAQQIVSVKDAKRASTNFIASVIGNVSAAKSMSLTLAETIYGSDNEPVFYRFQVNDKGFVLVSATDLVMPILAYSLEANFESGSSADYLYEQYREGIQAVKEYPSAMKTDAQIQAKSQWNHYTAANFQLNESKSPLKSVEPLVTANWNQPKYFNNDCPVNPYIASSINYRSYAGCVAVTMGALMNYYRYPDTGIGGVSYKPSDNGDGNHAVYQYERLTVNFANYHHNYYAMEPELNSYNSEVSRLLYNVGVSVEMGYGSEGSGAQSNAALEALKNRWQFSQSAKHQLFDDYAINDTTTHLPKYSVWNKQILQPELDAHCPLYYHGYPATGAGHAWIVDGYCDIDSVNTYYHCNWGWGGASNGFYALGAFRNNASYGGPISVFDREEGVFTGLADLTLINTRLAKPTSSSERVVAHSGTISDGAGNVKYKPNMTRYWMLAAPHTASYTITFDKIKTASNDFITIYNGPTETTIKEQLSGDYLMKAATEYSASVPGQVPGNFSGTALPAPITVNADSVLIKFTSNSDTIVDYGFTFHYTTTPESGYYSSCTANGTIVTATSGTLCDKASATASNQGRDSKPMVDCQWRIQTPGTVSYNIKFTKFDLKGGDFIDFYNTTTAGFTGLIARYDANNPPPVNHSWIMTTRKMHVIYGSDNAIEGTGFICEWSQAATGIDPYNNLTDIVVYPNPATDRIIVDLETETVGDITFQINDITGKQISSETIYHQGGSATYSKSISNVAPGIYFMNIQTKNGNTIRKFIVQ